MMSSLLGPSYRFEPWIGHAFPLIFAAATVKLKQPSGETLDCCADALIITQYLTFEILACHTL
jgi:hypothetical protein